MKKTGGTLDYVKLSPYLRTTGKFLCAAHRCIQCAPCNMYDPLHFRLAYE